MMKELALYIHGKDGCAGESEHYKPLFPECEIVGLDYQTFTPWETGKEIREAVTKMNAEYDSITLIANSIGAFFSMNAGIEAMRGDDSKRILHFPYRRYGEADP